MSRVVWQFFGRNKMTTGHHIGFSGETIDETSVFVHPKSVHHRFALVRLVVQSSAYQPSECGDNSLVSRTRRREKTVTMQCANVCGKLQTGVAIDCVGLLSVV